MNIFGLEGDSVIVIDDDPMHTTPEDVMVVPTPPTNTLLMWEVDVPTVPDAHTETHPLPPMVMVLDEPPTFTDPFPVMDMVLVTLPVLM